MNFETWEPKYMEILEDFGYSREHDEEAGRILSDMLGSGQISREALVEASMKVRNRTVVVCGNAPSLDAELNSLLSTCSRKRSVFIAADGATSILLEAGIVPEIIVTDLDGRMDDILKANRMGSLVVVHSHGDNIEKLQEFVPQLKRVIGTTQSRPLPGLYNFGGFTDGDRAVFLARYLDALEIRLIGFDFDDRSVTLRKHKKLGWARKLVKMALDDDSRADQ
jgi:uncharacterized Rossmann fold enzyme